MSRRRKHPPGTPVESDHGDFLFRAVRAHANTTEGLATFAVLLAVAVSVAGPAAWINVGSAVYLGGRLAHMLCYWTDLKTPRSVAFVVGLVGQTIVLAGALQAVL